MIRGIRVLVRTSSFKQVLKEWSLNVRLKQDPTVFANMYLEWMRDPLDHAGRQDLAHFMNFTRPRDWGDVMKVIGTALDKDVAAIFKSPAAEGFYDSFKATVVLQIQAYWEEFLASRKKAMGGGEVGPRDWSPRSKVCVCKKHPSKCTCKKPLP